MFKAYEMTGTEVTMISRKHPFRIYFRDMLVIAGIAAIVGSVLWYSWNY